MTADLSIDFEAIPFSVDDDQNVIVSNTILQIKFTIRDNEISQSIQLDSQQQYILRATITTKEQLCTLQVVLLYKKLAKIAQNVLFQISQLKKIINSRDPKFWDNIGLVAAQIGLRVLSTKSTCEPDFALFANSIKDYHLQYFSLYNSFDTKNILQPEVIDDLKFHENQVLLQLAAIKYQKVGKYPLILPLIFGYSAFRLYDTQFNDLKNNVIVIAVYGEDLALLKKIFEVSNKIYNGEAFTEEKPQLDKFYLINLFQLPTHFLNTGICLFMFQQLCHVSYLFKAEYFAIFSLIDNEVADKLTNAVISQSSKSGKSVALYTQYFFHLLMGNVPMLFNMKSDKEQPLYEYYTENFHNSLDQQYIDVYNLSEIKQISKVKELKEVEDLNKQKESKEVEDLKKDKELNKIILQSVCAFHQFQLDSIGKVSELFYKMEIFIENIKDIKNDKGDATFDLLDTVMNLQYNNHIFTKFELFKNQNFFIYQNHKDISGILEKQILERSKKAVSHQTPIILVDECLQSQKIKFPKCVKLCQMIFMRYEEKLIQLGKDQYIEIQTMLDSDEFKVINTFAAIKYKQHHLVINVILPLLSKELLESAKTELDKISMTDRFQNNGIDLYQTIENIITSVQSQNADQIFYTIHGNQKIMIEYLKSLNSLLGKSEYILIAMEYLRLEIDDYDLLDELVVHSPQILNIRNRTQFRNILFSGMVSYRNRGQYYEDFETNFYKLILSLFNPRGVETAFWKTFSIVAMIDVKLDEATLKPKDTKANTVISIQFVMEKFWKYSVKELIQEYFGVSKSPDLEEDQRKEQQVDNFISMFHEEHKPLLESLQKTFATTKFMFVPGVKQSTVIMVGTDLTVINFLTINQFCYNAMSSRANMGYINTQILGYVQPHASLLSSLQYEQRRVVVDDTGYTNSVGAIADTVKTFAEETPILVSLLYSMMTEKSVEMQFMCSSVCPSIWFQYNQKILNFNATSRHVVSFCVEGKKQIPEQTMYQFDSLTQTYNNIIIHKGAQKDAKFKLTKGDAHFELLQDNQNYNISCIASSTLNYEVVSVLNYQLMLAFIAKYSTSAIDEAAAQSTLQQLSRFFKRSVLLEFMHVILFMAKLTWQSATLIRNISLIMSQVDNGNIYVQYLHGGSITAAKSEDIFNLLERTPVPHNFMFLNPTFDYAFQNFNKKSSISIYEQVLDDSVAAAKETFQLLRQRLPVQPESTTKKEESSAKEAIVEQDGGARADVGSTTQADIPTKKEESSAKEAIVEQDGGAQADVGSTAQPQESQLPKTQYEAQEKLKDKQTCPMLIIVIPFDKKMCFTDSLDKARHKIFDFIVTFHGYPDLGLEKIDGCQVLPIECGHHVPEVLAEKVKAFTLNNVLQVGLDKKGAHLILDVNYKSQNWQYNLQKAEDLVKVQQQTEKDKNVKHAEILQSEIQKIVKHSFYKISCRQGCYTESFIEFLKINIPFNVFQDYGSNFIQIKQELDQTAKDKLDTMEQFQKCISFDIQFQPQGTTQFELGSTTMKAQTNDKQIRLSVLFIYDKQRIIYQLSQLYHMLCFNICNDEIISVFFTVSVDIYKFLEKLQLRLVFAQGENDYQYLYVENNPDTIQQKDEVLSAQILMDANLAAVQALNNQQNFSADARNLVMYTAIILSFKADVNIKCQYQAKNFQFTLTYNDLLEQLSTFGSIIYQYKNGTLFLKNSNIHLISIFRLNSPSFQSFCEDDWKYFSLLTQFCNQQENTRQQLFQQKFQTYFDQISKLLQKVTVDKVVYFGFQYECEQITYGKREHFSQRQFLSPNKLDSKQLLKLFVESKVIILSTKIKDNKKNKVLVKIYFF
uniref:Uncharacterized protein n=1 Tax=Spironucleus salmonicida TaxID=348837 RepID=V6LFA1_9EUKA|eukprot:EST43157.1 Hypothetical protein SS50377_17189 [Spironucleus salmonicida]